MKSNLLAVITNPALPANLRNLEGVDFFSRLIPTLVTVILIVGAIIFVFMLLWGGVQWITSGGDKTATEAARGRITAALVGITILFCVFALVKAVEIIFGVQILTIDIESLVIQ